MQKNVTFGVVVGNRGFFPSYLVKEGREEVVKTLKNKGYGTIVLSTADTPYGGVESLQDAQKCASLFKKHREEIDGIIVTLPNFGDEKAVANSLKLSGLNVPVLVHAFPDDIGKMKLESRRDSFCGKLSVCNNLVQYGIRFSLTGRHTMSVQEKDFLDDIDWFAAVCRVVKGMRNVRFGAVGARTGPFNTVRFSEKLLEQAGITTEVIDLSEMIARANSIKKDDKRIEGVVSGITQYCDCNGIPKEPLVRMAKFSIAVDDWMKEADLQGLAIQCWTSLEENYGIMPCTLMSMWSDKHTPCACEVDIAGVAGMYALQLASGVPAALMDWNNNYGPDPDRAVLFHCSNMPKTFLDKATMSYNEILAKAKGKEISYGVCAGRMKPGCFTYARVSTCDSKGKIGVYVGEGDITNDPLDSFGGFGVIHVKNLQGLLRYACENGFEHHVAVTMGNVSRVIAEALGKYLGFDTHLHA
jgi:L-fucose isomerase-like protein